MSGQRRDGDERGGMDHAIKRARTQQLRPARVAAREVCGNGAAPTDRKPPSAPAASQRRIIAARLFPRE